ncbi:MMPL family transporter [Streptomyces iconiensis]|uniref:MMPL family transporter n=1 Tax=Streptomyces iconiensis TaxID=1384038 RepID=A0ABT7A7I1_9ACTN|nr:MMPL family transporter [Streptomyces iconiensis]MDJ1137037.1 MMPL family transporter [Streptomyces iconiensis]
MTRWLVLHPWRVLVCALLAGVALASTAALVGDRTSSGGYIAQDTEAVRADSVLRERFGAGVPDLVLRVRAAEGTVTRSGAAGAGRAMAVRLARQPGVGQVFSYWTENEPRLLSRDRRSALIVADLTGDETAAARTARELVPRFHGDRGPFEVSATGASWASVQAADESGRDLRRAELLGLPLAFLILLVAFGSLTAALLPALVGLLAVTGSFAVLRTAALYVPVSTFAGSVTMALGFGLAIDYALFVVTRYREELAEGAATGAAIRTTMRTTGWAVLCSAATVAVCLSVLLLFPVQFLRSLAVAGITVVLFASAATLLVLPSLLAVIGPRIDRWDPLARRRRGGVGGVAGSSAGARSRGARSVGARVAALAVSRPVLAGGGASLLLATLLLPFGHARFGPTDERVLPAGVESHAAARHIEDEFALPWTRVVSIVLPRLDPLEGQAALDAYARRLSRVEGVAKVEGAGGTYRQGRRTAGQPTASLLYGSEGATWLQVRGSGPATRDEGLVERLRAQEAPGPRLVGGRPARVLDTKEALAHRLPLAAGLIGGCVALLLFLLTGSVVVPLKALVMGAVSLGASFGAMVHVFQDGHLAWLLGGFTVTGELETSVPVLMFCVAFALCVDYEVFLISRIQELHRGGLDPVRALETGLARTSRVINTAALLVASALVPLVTSDITLIKLIGFGLALAVLVDATVVRGVLVPAFMSVAGRLNWWAPAPLARWHHRFARRSGLIPAFTPAPGPESARGSKSAPEPESEPGRAPAPRDLDPAPHPAPDLMPGPRGAAGERDADPR